MGTEFDQEDWNAFYQCWSSRLFLFARQQTGTVAEAEDVLQEAFVQVWTRRERFPRIEPGILFTQIRRVAIDRSRSRQRRKTREADFSAVHAPPLFVESSSGDADDLQAALETLPPEQQEVLVLKIWGEQTFESIGKTLEISPNTAASRYRYGLERMRQFLGAESRS